MITIWFGSILAFLFFIGYGIFVALHRAVIGNSFVTPDWMERSVPGILSVALLILVIEGVYRIFKENR